MPPTSKEKQAQPRRRPGRVPTSCAECRRLKLRCDRNVPCEKCVSRGCGSICPDGSLTPGKGNRLVLANTEELHERIERLSSRIRELENALRALQANMTDEPHPLLQSASPRTTSFAQSQASGAPANLDESGVLPISSKNSSSSTSDCSGERVDDENFIDAFGTLTIGMNGESSFWGKTARSEYLIRAPVKQMPPPILDMVFPRLSKRILESNLSESTIIDKDLGNEVFQLLPPLSEAIHLCELYLEHGRYGYTPIPRKQLFDEVLTAVYRADSYESVQCHHSMSLLFIVFALALLFDPEQQPCPVQAQEYYYLARTSLGFSPPLHNTTLTSLQALIHMAQYLEFSDWETTASSLAWIYLGYAVRLGHSIGLHLNGARWKLSEETMQRRNFIYWQLFTWDTWTSFWFGRPPCISASYIDCAFPEDIDEFTGPDGQKEQSFHAWGWRYNTLMLSLMATAFGPKLPSYSTIVDLDRQIRDFAVPPHLRPHCNLKTPLEAPEYLHIQRWLVLSARESTLLNLHRAYFAQALHEQPHNLSKHRYIPSVIAIYRSAWRLIHGLWVAWKQAPLPLSRLNMSWSLGLSAAIVMCLFVTRATTCKMVPSTLSELDSIALLFEEAAPTCRPAALLLDSIQNLRRKGQESVDSNRQQQSTSGFSPADLDRLGGKTHLISPSTDESYQAPPPPTYSAPPPHDLYELDPSMTWQTNHTHNVHPLIAHDIRSFDMGLGIDLQLNNIFDLPTLPNEPQPQPQSQPLHQTLQQQGVDQMSHMQYNDLNYFNTNPPGAFQMGYQTASPGYGAGGPILDSTWQSFVEQLGF